MSKYVVGIAMFLLSMMQFQIVMDRVLNDIEFHVICSISFMVGFLSCLFQSQFNKGKEK
jgi:hypothetical protein